MSRRQPVTRWLVVAFALLSLGGCASRQADDREPNPDPLEPVNRIVYKVNDFGDRYLAKPLAKAYEKASPRVFRVGANNFLENLRYPITIVNQFLQGKFRKGGSDLARFLLNSTVGVIGIFDPATDVGLKAHDEDFGQTLAVWGMPEGPFLMVPVFGPYSMTHAFGELLDTQASIIVQYPDSSLTTKIGIWYLVHKRYRVLPADEEIQRAFDPYLFIRDAYLQHRKYEIHDGNVPEEELFPEDEFEDVEE